LDPDIIKQLSTCTRCSSYRLNPRYQDKAKSIYILWHSSIFSSQKFFFM